MSTQSDSKLPRLSYSFAKQFGVLLIPIDKQLHIIYRPHPPFSALLEARRLADAPLPVREITANEFDTLLAQTYAQTDLNETAANATGTLEDLSSLMETLPRTADVLDSEDDAPIIRLINGILQQAIQIKASDVHIEPYQTHVNIRFRIDGSLRTMLDLPVHLNHTIVSRVKVMAQLDIAQKRIAQDGRFSLNLGIRAIDVRVSTLPSQYGERVVMRLLEKTRELLNLADLGMSEQNLELFEQILRIPNGIILVTGPTGSGKTTSLYAALSRLNDGSRNILTVEDPVEYAIEGIGQTQVNTQVGMSFAAGLRAILRQDPDVIMVGEIRDTETAEIAVQAALTGHLVLSTVHTNSAIAAIPRLQDMGVAPFLLASSLSAIIAQRLVRRLCPACKTPYTPKPHEFTELGLRKSKTITFYTSKGCQKCHHIGYDGRLALYEIIIMDDILQAMIHAGAHESDMANHALNGKETLLRSGTNHVIAGLTSVDEILRVCHSASEDV